MTRDQSPLAGKAIFITGARRSGTYWLQRIITSHAQIGAVPSETHLFSHGIRPLMDRLTGTEPADPTVGRVWADREAVNPIIRELCDAVFAPFRAGDDGWVSERTPLHVYHLDLVHEIYPDAKIVQIVRDGRDVSRSLVAQDWGPTTHEAAAMEWRDAVRAARQAALSPEVYREVHYEAVLADPAGAAAELFDWLGVAASQGEFDAAEVAAGEIANTPISAPGAERWRSELSRRQIDQIETVASAELELMGYALSGD